MYTFGFLLSKSSSKYFSWLYLNLIDFCPNVLQWDEDKYYMYVCFNLRGYFTSFTCMKYRLSDKCNDSVLRIFWVTNDFPFLICEQCRIMSYMRLFCKVHINVKQDLYISIVFSIYTMMYFCCCLKNLLKS